MRRILNFYLVIVIALIFNSVAANDLQEYERKQKQSLQQHQQVQQEGISSQVSDNSLFAYKTLREYSLWKENREKDIREFASNVKRSWGYFRAPSNKKWVEYSIDRNSVAEVDFEEGRVIVEVLSEKEENEESVRMRLTAAIERVINSRGSSESLPIQSIKEMVDARANPILRDQIADNLGTNITVENAHIFAEKVALEAYASGTLTGKKKFVVTFALVSDHLKKRMEPYINAVQKYASIYSLDEALVLATIHTESFFNPLARSSCGAIGLMQLMPDRGGLEAYKYVFNKSNIPSERFLIDAENNIQLGCAYIHILQNDYFKNITISQSRNFCGIAGYNTGPGNVAKAFHGTRDIQKAIPIINEFKPAEKVYNHMLIKLPYLETRTYLQNVVTRMDLYR